jgi:hypothetical protein
MARTTKNEAREEAADEAINRVLAAEREARERVSLAQAQAAKLVAQARLRARRIHERTDARVSRLRAACREWSAREVARRQEEARRILSSPVADDGRSGRLSTAVARLAAVLTGDESP